MAKLSPKNKFQTIVLVPKGLKSGNLNRMARTSIQKDLLNGMQRAVKRIEMQAKIEAPVKTGFLMGNITSKVDGRVSDVRVEGTVGTYKSVFYASWVHSGHMAWGRFRIPANPFLTRALEKTKMRVHKILKDVGVKSLTTEIAGMFKNKEKL